MLGDSTIPVNHLLKTGRDAVIRLKTLANKQVQVLTHKSPLATADAVAMGGKTAIGITSKVVSEVS